MPPIRSSGDVHRPLSHGPAEVAELLEDIARAEQQIDSGEGEEHESAKAEVLRRLSGGVRVTDQELLRIPSKPLPRR